MRLFFEFLYKISFNKINENLKQEIKIIIINTLVLN